MKYNIRKFIYLKYITNFRIIKILLILSSLRVILNMIYPFPHISFDLIYRLTIRVEYLEASYHCAALI